LRADGRRALSHQIGESDPSKLRNLLLAKDLRPIIRAAAQELATSLIEGESRKSFSQMTLSTFIKMVMRIHQNGENREGHRILAGSTALVVLAGAACTFFKVSLPDQSLLGLIEFL
jgi:hypothetical protein